MVKCLLCSVFAQRDSEEFCSVLNKICDSMESEISCWCINQIQGGYFLINAKDGDNVKTVWDRRSNV